MIKEIAVAVYGSEHAQRALGFACEIAQKFGARLHLVHVIHHVRISSEFFSFAEAEHFGPDEEPASPKDVTQLSPGLPGGLPVRSGGTRPVTYEMMKAIAESIMKTAREKAQANGIGRIEERVLWGDPAEELLKYVETARIDVVVAGRLGLGSLTGLIMGSVTTKLCSHSAKPVVTVA